MMREDNLLKHEIIILLVSTAFFPLLSLMLGDALVALLLGGAGMMKLMFGERTIFAVTAIFLWWILNKSGLIAVKVKQFITSTQIIYYISQVIIITIIVSVFTTKYISLIYTLFFIILNFLIAWEEEFVYRLLVPEILKKLFSNFVIICLLQSLIFSYLGHMDGTILDNLIYRLPLAILLYYIRNKTDNIFLPTTIHAIWNIILDFI